jgi:hypothetical protein
MFGVDFTTSTTLRRMSGCLAMLPLPFRTRVSLVIFLTIILLANFGLLCIWDKRPTSCNDDWRPIGTHGRRLDFLMGVGIAMSRANNSLHGLNPLGFNTVDAALPHQS